MTLEWLECKTLI